jgi:adhesin transport system outer membrane protein
MTLREAIEQALHTNPSIEAARANRRATTFELRQAQGRLLPQVGLYGDTGAEKIDQPEGFAADVNNQWRNRAQGGVVARQVIFDGWDRANDVYKGASRVDAAALRVLARSETIALDAIEAYIDVQRHVEVLAISRRNVDRHRKILADVRELERGGKGSRSEALQVEERLAGAEAAVERVRQSLLEAEAKFRRVVGTGPRNLAAVRVPANIPMTREQAGMIGAANHPLVGAAEADMDTASAAMKQVRSGYFPQVSLEMRGSVGNNIGGTPGRDNEAAGLVVLSWNLFDGLITRHKTHEFAERWGQATAERDERLRQIQEELEKSIALRSTGISRLPILRRQSAKATEVVRAYEDEFRAAKRSLLDLLDAEGARFNTQIQVVTQEAVNVFSGFRILAASGRLLAAMDIVPPPESNAGQRVLTRDKGLFSTELAPLRQ